MQHGFHTVVGKVYVNSISGIIIDIGKNTRKLLSRFPILKITDFRLWKRHEIQIFSSKCQKTSCL